MYRLTLPEVNRILAEPIK